MSEHKYVATAISLVVIQENIKIERLAEKKIKLDFW
jgi:hypothetical protein